MSSRIAENAASNYFLAAMSPAVSQRGKRYYAEWIMDKVGGWYNLRFFVFKAGIGAAVETDWELVEQPQIPKFVGFWFHEEHLGGSGDFCAHAGLKDGDHIGVLLDTGSELRASLYLFFNGVEKGRKDISHLSAREEFRFGNRFALREGSRTSLTICSRSEWQLPADMPNKHTIIGGAAAWT
jgi:hypothetical protein